MCTGNEPRGVVQVANSLFQRLTTQGFPTRLRDYFAPNASYGLRSDQGPHRSVVCKQMKVKRDRPVCIR